MLPRRHEASQDGGMVATVTGIVLAGGASRRMGTDKRIVLVEGEPMLRRVVTTAASVADELIVVVARSRPVPPDLLDGLDARVVTDRRPDAGPLAGIEAGLLSAGAERVLVVAGDLPWIEAGLLRRLLEALEAAHAADAAAAVGPQGPEPLLAAYRRDAAVSATVRLLEGGERRARALLEVLTVVTVAGGESSTRNVNEPSDLAGVAQ
jgi:molybdopterin-guanine dinucleotide biosynthesis protein A